MPRTLTQLASQLCQVRSTRDLTTATDRDLLKSFLSAGDESAFEALVSRHNRLVRSAIAKVLSDPDDAEDAFQATFLILVRRAKSIDWRAGVGPWLYGVAHRVAVKARDARRTRARKELQANTKQAESEEPADLSWREACAQLHAELDRLPDRYRLPLLLCFLEGKTRDEAAAALKITAGAVKGRLERGREMLSKRLSRRGLALSTALLAAVAEGRVGANSPPSGASVLDAVRGSASDRVLDITREATMSTILSNLTKVLAVAIGLGIVTVVTLATGNATPANAPAPVKPTNTTAPVTDKPNVPGMERLDQPKEVSGQVLGLDGKPFAGAKLFLVGKGDKSQRLGASGPDGRFTVIAPRGEKWVILVAKADGAGVDFVDLGRIPLTAEVEFRLAKDRPIRGRIVDTQGMPVAGATVAVQHVAIYGNNLDPLLAEWKTRNPFGGLPGGTKQLTLSDAGLLPSAPTDKDGRFTVRGAGDERLVVLRIHGAGIATDELLVVNRAGFDPKPYNQATEDKIAMFSGYGQMWLLRGPEPSVVAEAEKPIRGVVRDKDTGEPRAGVKVSLSGTPSQNVPHVSSTTDAEGRYEIHGARKAKSYLLRVPSDTTTGHVFAFVRADDTAGYEPVTVDIEMKKGVIVTGRLIDKSTGKALFGAVYVSCLSGNKSIKEYPGFEMHSPSWFTQQDGTFRCVTIPGPTILMGGLQDDLDYVKYKPAMPDPKFPQFFRTDPDGSSVYFVAGGGVSPLQGNFAKVLEIEPGTTVVKHDIELEPASSLPVTIRDADGKPVASAWATGISPQDWHIPIEVKGGSCVAYHLEGKPRLMVFYEPTKKLFGTLALERNEKEPQKVTLGPGGSIKGRVVDESGKPMAGVMVELYHSDRTAGEIHSHVHRAKPVETDTDGRFHIDDVIPGARFLLGFARGRTQFEPASKPPTRTVEPGQAADAGELKLKPKPTPGE